MLFPLGAWCPSGEREWEKGRTGTKVIAVYSYSTYVLKSIHKKVQACLSGCRYAVSYREGSFSENPNTRLSYTVTVS